MGRTSTFSDQEIFTAVSAQIAKTDEFRIQGVIQATGVSVGSLYHRYGSREGLMAAAWLDALSTFQQKFIAALQDPSPDAGERAALLTPQFSRSHRDQAIILCVGRRETLLNDKAPQDLRQSVDALNRESQTALEAFAERQNLDMQTCLHGIVAFPLASVRLYLPTRRVPKSVDAFVRAAYRASIQAGRQNTQARQDHSTEPQN